MKAITDNISAYLSVDISDNGLNASVHRHRTSISPSQFPSHNPRCCLSVDPSGVIRYSFEANFHIVKSNLVSDNEEDLKQLLVSLDPKSSFVLCPGLPSSTSYSTPAKRLKLLPSPFKHQMDEKCMLWHIPKNRKCEQHKDMFNKCTPCKKLYSYLEARNHQSVPDAVKKSQISTSSKCRISFLSPKSQQQRRANVRKQVKKQDREIKKLQRKLAVTLPNEQSEDLSKAIAEIQHKHKKEVENILADADKAGQGKAMRALWIRI